MTTRIETLPNEILLHIFSYLSWFDLLTSLWLLNIRFNSVICSILHCLNSGLVTQNLSYNKCSRLFSLILNSSSLSSSIQRIHFDGTNSNAYDLCYEWLFTDENILGFPNLKSLSFTRCGSIKPVFQCLNSLIEHQLDELTLKFDVQVFCQFFYANGYSRMVSDIEEQWLMIKQLLCKLFSGQCQLKSLQLDISNDLRNGPIHQCLQSYSNSSNFIQYQHQSCCVTLRHLHIQINQTYFLENLIEHVPNLEHLLVEVNTSLGSCDALKSNEKWFDKVPKLRYFSLKTFISDDSEFIYLKWLLNNLNYIEKLQLHIKNANLVERECQNIWRSFIDANFVRQYCLPDEIPNLIYLDFYICTEFQLSFDDVEKLINSFKIHSFFVSHRWTNVKCLFDPIMSYQHLFSCFNNTFQSSNNFINYSYIFNWTPFDEPNHYGLYPSLYLFLEKINELSSNISCVKLHPKSNGDFDKSDLRMSLEVLSQMRQNNRLNLPFRNVTKIQLGAYFNRKNGRCTAKADRNEIREKMLAHLISMTVQLKYLLFERFEWLLHVVQYTSNQLRMDALSTVQYVEFGLPSCHYGRDEAIHIGKHLVPFLRTYMPHLQTLHLWRSDDFPWTSIRPNCGEGHAYGILLLRWLKSLSTPESIVEHVNVFEQDLCQLVKNLKELTFLSIYGRIPYEKIEPYQSMAQALFPISQIYAKHNYHIVD